MTVPIPPGYGPAPHKDELLAGAVQRNLTAASIEMNMPAKDSFSYRLTSECVRMVLIRVNTRSVEATRPRRCTAIAVVNVHQFCKDLTTRAC